MAISLASEGATILLTARSKDQLEETAAMVREAGGEAVVKTADATSEGEVHAVRDVARAEFGKLHILINNAGLNLRKPIVDFTLDEWRMVQDTNVTSAFLFTRAFVPLMKGQGYGRILNMTSIMSHVSLPGRAAYSASKAALLGMTKALALELAEEKITVNGISPGPFATEINQVLIQDEQKNAEFLSTIPLHRWGDPKDVGEMALYLCREEAGFITGADFLIDGGWTAK
jgi:NAD(P)-dependent dehydrogenase (short-subunit alcohol dehydrogenase family)